MPGRRALPHMVASWVLVWVAQITPNVTAGEIRSSYELGRGLELGSSGITLGGYASINYVDTDEAPWVVEVSDLSLLISWDSGGRWRAFSELEIGESLVLNSDELTADEAEFEMERTYLDWLGINGVNLRFGKFLTPVGHWNQVHADPLVWTVSRPLTTRAAFANHSTGLMLWGNANAGDGQLDYQLYVDATRALDPIKDKPSPPLEMGAFDDGYGARLVYHPEEDNWQIGLSVADYTAADLPGRRAIGGIDFLWRRYGYELSGELVARLDSPGKSWFLQGVVPVGQRFYIVNRYEDFDNLGYTGRVKSNSLSLVFRPRPPISLKLEYIVGDDAPGIVGEGFLASAAVLF